MRRKLSSLAIVVGLAGGTLVGCTVPEDQSTRGTTFGQGVVAAVATPVLWLVKIPICATTVAMAAPLGALSTMAPNRRDFMLRELANGVDNNCGPPNAAVQTR